MKKKTARQFIKETKKKGRNFLWQTRKNTRVFEERIRARLQKTKQTIVDKKIFDLRLYAADALSFANLLSGLISIYFSIQKEFPLALIFIGLAIIFDSLDGTIARALKRESLLGLQLDSFSDLVSFGMATTTLLVMRFDFALPILVASAVLIGAGAYRLARYNVIKIQNPTSKTYIGTPITWNGIIFPALFLLNAHEVIVTVVLLLMSILMVSTMRIKRPF
jgi:CDP-diacylglycerol---serine O-phosphatidyltransferase